MTTRTLPTGDPAPAPHEETYSLAREEYTSFM
jgi:hypothetical protein